MLSLLDTLAKSLVLIDVFSTALNSATYNIHMRSCQPRIGAIVDPFSRVLLKGVIFMASKSQFPSCKYFNSIAVQGHSRFLSGLKKAKL